MKIIPHFHITLGRAMLAVAVLAVIFAVYRALGENVGTCILAWIIPAFLAAWAPNRERPGRAVAGLGVTTAWAMVLNAYMTVFDHNIAGDLLAWAVLITLTPLALGFGIAWARSTSRHDAARRRSPAMAGGWSPSCWSCPSR